MASDIMKNATADKRSKQYMTPLIKTVSINVSTSILEMSVDLEDYTGEEL